ncbi:tRNA (5-methylaminomethyl-2-thiouridine)(34)-methyltransferase MnmD [Planctomycetota bacterium]|nr:tRNA (5-methylaminomethyl-2-thiouridine)(34)-methyltransferase MnmD [Planctomycetota bacterium]
MSKIGKPRLSWGNDGTLRSEQFDDVYYSVEGGVKETTYVFLTGNDLPQRFEGCEEFTIAETGFGTGLNFLVTWRAWLEAKKQKAVNQNAVLKFISFEMYPLSATEIMRAAEMFGELRTLGEQLAKNYPNDLEAGKHLIQADSDIQLLLICGDINETIDDMNFKADAWYLDGFSPSKNEGMWSEHVFEKIGQLTAKGGTIATFTAAGFVRRGLMNHGYTMSKVKGFGRKREMLIGAYETA